MSSEQDEVRMRGNSVPWSKILDSVKAVCHLALPDRSCMASGILGKCKINGEEIIIILTMKHVVNNEEMAKQFIATFNYDGRDDTRCIPLYPDIFFKTCEEYDYTMIGVKKQDVDDLQTNLQIHPVDLKPIALSDVHKIDIIHIAQHPGGKQKRFSQGLVREIKETFILYDADTAPGSSGSPVFFTQGGTCHVLALHKSGGAVTTHPNRQNANKGIFVNVILNHANGVPVQPHGIGGTSFTEKEITRVGLRIADKWAEVAQATGFFKVYELRSIRINQCYHSPDSKAIKMLSDYKRRKGTRKDLAEALEQFGEDALAERVLNRFFQFHAREPED